MRPVNLIPADQRSGESRPLRSGPLAYVIVGALAALLLGVSALVLAGNQIDERKAEIAQLEVEDRAAEEKAGELVAYTQFRSLREERLATIASLADSRFDWERVMRELSLILPEDAWLTALGASASPEAGTGEAAAGAGSTLRESIPGPALELTGCAAGQESVAGFVTALKDIDGVTRVGVEVSELSEQEAGAASAPSEAEGEGSGGGGGGGDADCRTRDFIASFSIVVAFDAAPVPVSAEAAAEPLTATEQAETTTSENTEGG
jgi:Tfp pilus assembly protein PilN